MLFTCFWIDLVHVLATTENMCAVAGYTVYKYTKIQGLRFQRNYIIARDQKSDLHGTSFQSSPKISRILITKPICIQWKFTTVPTTAVLLSKIFFQLLSSVQFVDQHVSEKL